MWGLCIVCRVFSFPPLFTYSVGLKRCCFKPYTATTATSRLASITRREQKYGCSKTSGRKHFLLNAPYPVNDSPHNPFFTKSGRGFAVWKESAIFAADLLPRQGEGLACVMAN